MGKPEPTFTLHLWDKTKGEELLQYLKDNYEKISDNHGRQNDMNPSHNQYFVFKLKDKEVKLHKSSSRSHKSWTYMFNGYDFRKDI